MFLFKSFKLSKLFKIKEYLSKLFKIEVCYYPGDMVTLPSVDDEVYYVLDKYKVKSVTYYTAIGLNTTYTDIHHSRVRLLRRFG